MYSIFFFSGGDDNHTICVWDWMKSPGHPVAEFNGGKEDVCGVLNMLKILIYIMKILGFFNLLISSELWTNIRFSGLNIHLRLNHVFSLLEHVI